MKRNFNKILLAYLLTYLPTYYIHTYLPTFVLTYLLTYLLAYLLTYLLTHKYIQIYTLPTMQTSLFMNNCLRINSDIFICFAATPDVAHRLFHNRNSLWLIACPN